MERMRELALAAIRAAKEPEDWDEEVRAYEEGRVPRTDTASPPPAEHAEDWDEEIRAYEEGRIPRTGSASPPPAEHAEDWEQELMF